MFLFNTATDDLDDEGNGNHDAMSRSTTDHDKDEAKGDGGSVTSSDTDEEGELRSDSQLTSMPLAAGGPFIDGWSPIAGRPAPDEIALLPVASNRRRASRAAARMIVYSSEEEQEIP